MILAQSAATARFYAGRHGQHLDQSADLVGLSAANAAAAFSGDICGGRKPYSNRNGRKLRRPQPACPGGHRVSGCNRPVFLTKPLQYLHVAFWAPSYFSLLSV